MNIKKYFCLNFYENIGDWGLGIGDWGMGIGSKPQTPIPNTKTPKPIKKYKI